MQVFTQTTGSAQIHNHTNYYGSGELNKESDQLASLVMWYDNDWIDVKKFTAVPAPLTFVAVPLINGQSNVEFVCNDIALDIAERK
jgi:hypothetical protein